MRRAFALMAMVAIAAGCSSGHTVARRGSTTKPTAANGPSSSASFGAPYAVGIGKHMLDSIVLPASARPWAGSAPNVVRGPSSVPAIGNLEFAHRLWRVDESPHALSDWLQAHIPTGYTKDETSAGTDHGVPSWGVADRLTIEPQNISYAEVEYEMGADASGRAIVRVDTVVGWTQPRPVDEFVPASDMTVTVSVVHEDGSVGKRVVATGPKLVQPIVREFDQLNVSPPNQEYNCPEIGPHTVSYQVAFASSATANPTLIASIGKCGDVRVTVGGHAAPGLGDFSNASFADAVSLVLGFPVPHFG